MHSISSRSLPLLLAGGSASSVDGQSVGRRLHPKRESRGSEHLDFVTTTINPSSPTAPRSSPMSRPPGGRPHGGPRSAPQPIGSNLPLASSLPKVSFRRIPPNEAQDLSIPAGVDDSLNVGYGFNDGEPFEKPEHYMRFVEPIEADLKRQVEYDMDEQDKEWIDALNAERKKEGSDAVSYETFEIIIDRLEKEWFDLVSRGARVLWMLADLCPRPDETRTAQANAGCHWSRRRSRQSERGYRVRNLRRRRMRELQCHRFLRRMQSRGSSGLLRHPLHPRRSMALPQMHRLAGSSCVLRALPERGRSIQADDAGQVGECEAQRGRHSTPC